MMDQEELLNYKLKGYCCSQIIMAAWLDRAGKEDNLDLIKAMGGLCMGSRVGSLCGALSAAICVMTLASDSGDTGAMCQDLSDWFEDTYGSLQCTEIIQDNPMFKIEKCPALVANTFDQMEEIMEINGRLPW